MGIMQRDLDGGLTAAVDAMFALLPGLRAAFEAFVPPSDAPKDPPMDAARQLLADAEAFLTRIRDAHAERRTGEMIDYPHKLEDAMRVPQAWYESIRSNPTRYECRAFGNVVHFARTVVKLRQAHQLIRQHGWRGNKDLSDAWRMIGGLMYDRDDVLVVTGSVNYSDGIRRRAQEALVATGAVGGWWVYTIDAVSKWKFLLHEPHTWHGDDEDYFERAVPDGLYADVVHDPDSDRPVLPEELGPDTLPPLR